METNGLCSSNANRLKPRVASCSPSTQVPLLSSQLQTENWAQAQTLKQVSVAHGRRFKSEKPNFRLKRVSVVSRGQAQFFFWGGGHIYWGILWHQVVAFANDMWCFFFCCVKMLPTNRLVQWKQFTVEIRISKFVVADKCSQADSRPRAAYSNAKNQKMKKNSWAWRHYICMSLVASPGEPKDNRIECTYRRTCQVSWTILLTLQKVQFEHRLKKRTIVWYCPSSMWDHNGPHPIPTHGVQSHYLYKFHPMYPSFSGHLHPQPIFACHTCCMFQDFEPGSPWCTKVGTCKPTTPSSSEWLL